MDKDVAVALAEFCDSLSMALSRLGTSLRDVSAETKPPLVSGPSTVATPWRERVLRQALIIAELLDRGPVSRQEWYQVASTYGYRGRGVAGFFRSDGSGLLQLDDGVVTVTERGRQRLHENEDRVRAWRAAHPPE